MLKEYLILRPLCWENVTYFEVKIEWSVGVNMVDKRESQVVVICITVWSKYIWCYLMYTM